MARIRALSCERRAELTDGWRMAFAPDGVRPSDDAGWIAAPVPGTAAQALENAGQSTPDVLASLQARHIWYRCPAVWQGTRRLRFDSLAPHCDIYLGDRLVHVAKSMFDPVEIDLENDGKTELYLHFKPLTAETVTASPKRQRWRPHLVASPHMRNARATLLGHMPGWCPAIQPVGPNGRVEILLGGEVTASGARVRTWLEGTTGHVEISIKISGIEGGLVASCWSGAAPMERGEDGLWRARIAIEKPPLWWPHTHGDPHLLPLTIYGEDLEIALGSVGFRALELNRGADGDGFGLICNGVPIFCRGANWTNADIIRLPRSAEAYGPLLRRARDAGMNMLRVSGIMTREAPEFFKMADKLGIFIWYDEPFANFDYDFGHLSGEFGIERSVSDFLTAIETSPSLAVVCGGSEMAQQGAMLSLPESIWRQKWCTETLEELVRAIRPDVVTVPNSPWGGELPFQTNKGVTHYFGVGAYQRPLEDARRAGVRFASECLAFAQLPQPERLAANAGGAVPGSPEWKARVVRDLKADWDFEDTRDFYLGLLHGVEPDRLRVENPERYLALSAALPGEVMEATFAEWRRVGSPTRGGLVWFLSDLGPGFGWGVIDSGGVPKPAWHALRRAFRPVTVAITDEGLNGLDCHVINESRTPRDLTVALTCYGEDGSIVIDGAQQIALPPRGAQTLSSTGLLGIFFDIAYAYRFGPPAHAATAVRLTDAATGAFLAEAFHFPHGRGAEVGDVGLAAAIDIDAQGQAFLILTTQRLARSVHIAAEGFEPEDDWFHLAPGAGRRIALKGRGRPQGWVTAVNATGRVHFQ